MNQPDRSRSFHFGFVTTITLAAGACGSRPAVLAPSRAETPAVVERDPRERHFGDLRQYTFGGENAEAYWSHDGKELIFQATRPGWDCDQIFRMPADRGNAGLSRVSTGSGRTTCSYFFPGNRHVLFSSTHEANAACPAPPDRSQGYVWALYDTYDIYRARADGTEVENLSRAPGYDAEATVCAKDGSIVFTSTRDGDLELYRMDADGKNVVRLTRSPGYDGGAYFSPDCKQLVWRASRPKPGPELEDYQKLLARGLVRPTTLEIWVGNADGTEARQVTSLGAASFAPSWFPSGDRIIFSSNVADSKGREFDLFAINANGTGLEQITFTGGFDGFPMFSPDGTQLAFSSNRNGKARGDTNVFVARWIDTPDPVKAVGSCAEPLGGGSAACSLSASVSIEADADPFFAHVERLASDELEGRGVGTKGLELAADYIEAQLRRYAAPAGDNGGFRQRVKLPTHVRATELAARLDGAVVDAQPAGFSASGKIAAPIVYVGYGITAPKLGVDDYRGLDVKGKIVLARRFAPEHFEIDDQRRTSDARWKAWNAREHGAVALLLADLPEPGENRPERDAPRMAVDTLGSAGLPVLYLRRSAAEPLRTGRHRGQLAVTMEATSTPSDNIVARIAGNGTLPGVVVVGAHYDHLGMGGSSSLAPEVTAVHHGADDNASGVAALLQIAERLHAQPERLARDVILVAFTGEEIGILGSTEFTKAPPAGLKLEDVVAMLNLDMVGRMRENRLQVLGVETAREWESLVPSLCVAQGLECGLAAGGFGASDQTPFYARGVPVLHFFTGSHRDYHKPSDEAKYINATGGAAVAALVTEVARTVAAHAPLTAQLGVAPPRAGDLRAAGASLGTVPDYSGPPAGQPGVLLAGVRSGGPADQAGLRRGDILLAIDGHDCRTVEDFMFVLSAATPGNRGRVTVLRDGARLELDVVFGPPMRR